MFSITKQLKFAYITKVLSIVIGLLSVLIVVPKISSNPNIYAIYTLCIGLGMFFNYTDLGFLSAGQKYAAESFAQSNRYLEIRIIGFVLFVLSIFIFLIMIMLVILAVNPTYIVKSTTESDFDISTKLILILAFSAPTIIIQKFNFLISTIRIEEYIYQIIELFFNSLKILSIYFFTYDGGIDITGYYLSTQIFSLLSAIICTVILIKRYQYPLKKIIINLKFSKKIFHKTKSLALSSMFLTLAWILFFELDTIILSKFYGIKILASYGIAFVFLNFCRNIYNALYSPYISYFYHFTGRNDEIGLNNAFRKLLRWTIPLVIIPPIALSYYMDNIIAVWVGVEYESSIILSRIFVVTIAVTALYIPISYLIIAKSFNKVLRINALSLPLVFYTSLFIFGSLGITNEALALSKLITIVLSLILYIYYLIKLFNKSFLSIYLEFFRKIILPIFIFFFIVLLMPVPIKIIKGDFYSYVNLGLAILLPTIISIVVYYISFKDIRNLMLEKIRINGKK